MLQSLVNSGWPAITELAESAKSEVTAY
jgi:hypothetical protein